MAECELCGKTAGDPHALGASCPLPLCPQRVPVEEPADEPAPFQGASEDPTEAEE